MQLFKDGIGGGRPSKWLAILVVRSDKVVDALNKLFDAGERAAADRFVSDQGEETLHLIQPRTVGRDEVQVWSFGDVGYRVVLSTNVEPKPHGSSTANH